MPLFDKRRRQGWKRSFNGSRYVIIRIEVVQCRIYYEMFVSRILEVANATPGIFSFINYAKADVWAAGAIAYEVFGLENPFYHKMDRKGLDSRNYR